MFAQLEPESFCSLLEKRTFLFPLPFVLLLLRLLASVKEIQAFEGRLIQIRNNRFLKNTHSYPEFTKSSEYEKEESNMADNCIYCTNIIVTWTEQLN